MAVDTQPPLDFEEIDGSDPVALGEWYAIYQKSFPHPGEQEELEAFKKILELNNDRAAQERFGPYREYLLAIRDSTTHKIVGGLNFGVTTSQEHRDAGFMASVQAIFLFIDIRGRLSPRRLLHEVNRRAITAFDYPQNKDAGDIAIFFEANDPLAMSEAERREDVDYSGTDPFRRYKLWLDAGAQPLDFNYIQPALDHGKHPVDFLDLFYLGRRGLVSPKVLLRHLYSFCSISVLKGKDARDNPDYQKMVAELSGMQVVPLLNRDESAKLVEIQATAKKIRAEQGRPKSHETFPSQKLPEGERRSRRSLMRSLGWDPIDWLYRAGYSTYHRLESEHNRMIWFELGVGGLALFLTAASIFLHVNRPVMLEGCHFGQVATSLPGVDTGVLRELCRQGVRVMMWGNMPGRAARIAETFQGIVDVLDVVVVLLLGSYVVVQAIVRSRRSYLGNRFDGLWRELDVSPVPRPGETDATHSWFKNELLERLKKLNDYGPVSGSAEWEDERTRWLSQISDYSSSIYSDRRAAGRVDEEWRRKDLGMLRTVLQADPDGLWAFKIDGCTDRIFCNVVVPIRPPSRAGQIDLDNLEVDMDAVAALTAGVPPPQGEQGTYLLILRQLAITPSRKQPRTPELEVQYGLVLTMIVRVAMMVDKLAGKNGIRGGIPKNCTLLSVSASDDSASLLKWLGFSLVQRPPSHSSSAHGDSAQSNLSLYGMVLDGQDESALRMRELLRLTSALRRHFE